MLLSVGQLSRLTGLTIRALHHYDAIALLSPSQRSEAGYRQYTQSDVVRLYRIQALQRLGLSLAEIGAALDRDAQSLEQLMAQQLIQLDEQIARATLLRAQLQMVHERLQSGGSPEVDDWLATLDMIGAYDRHCSPAELRKLLDHRNDSTDAWRALIREVREAMNAGVAVGSDDSHALARRWMRLVMRRAGGDAGLARKMKLAFYDDPSVQGRTQAGSGFDKSMMDYLLAATASAHRALWLRHLTPGQVDRLQWQGRWAREWMETVALAQDQMGQGSSSAAGSFRLLLQEFCDGDPSILEAVCAALRSDEALQELWTVSPEFMQWLSEANGESEQ